MALPKRIGKLANIALNGTHYEKRTALKILDELQEKYHFNLQELLSDEVKIEKEFKYKNESEKIILEQTILKILDAHSFVAERYKYKKNFIVKMTKEQATDAEILFDACIKAYKKEMKLFTRAFILKNELYPETGNDEQPSRPSTLSREDIEKIRKMEKGIDKVKYQKQIEAAE